ncbi:MurR/RpiR family transcriptional regulator [Lactobacillus crispatus]|uniref:MurR/RpiR family transcriptional regulator n=1 Tax=Lactobacillus crispatus TaxID=47770 RepID=UPI003D3AD913
MIIKDWLVKKNNFTEVELKIASYFSDSSNHWKDMSLRSIAKSIYVSPSAITRFCKKAGFSGYNEFRNAYFKEKAYLQNQKKNINPSFPFEYVDNVDEISNKIKDLYIQTINDTFSLLKFDKLEHVKGLLDKFDNIVVFSLGNLAPLYNFQYKMLKIGKQVSVISRTDEAYYYVKFHAKDYLFILVSYTGETPLVLKVALQLQRLKAETISLTSLGGNTLSTLTDLSFNIATGEKLTDNFGDYSLAISENYLFDLFYSLEFSNDFIQNYHLKSKTAKEYQRERKSNNSLLNN